MLPPIPPPALAASAAGASPREFRLDIVTEAAAQPPLAVVWFTAASKDAAVDQARRFVDAHTGDHADYLDVIEPSTPATPAEVCRSERDQS